jgi:hypothetical protein
MLVALSSISGLAVQQDPNASSQDAAGASDVQWDDRLNVKISVDQPAGTVSDFVARIRETDPLLNIVVTESASAMRLPEIRLEHVPIRAVLSLISTLTNSEVDVSFESQLDGSDANVVLISSQFMPESNQSPCVRVFNVKRILEATNREALLASLDEGFQMMEQQDLKVDIKVHEATGLMFIKGTGPQLELAESVLNEIESGLNPMPSFAPSDPLSGGLQTPTQNLQPSDKTPSVKYSQEK